MMWNVILLAPETVCLTPCELHSGERDLCAQALTEHMFVKVRPKDLFQVLGDLRVNLIMGLCGAEGGQDLSPHSRGSDIQA